jgi:hypothetical protein
MRELRQSGFPATALLLVLLALAAAALVLTGLTYGVARAAEPLLPGLSAEAAEHHEHDEATGTEHEHDEPTAESPAP